MPIPSVTLTNDFYQTWLPAKMIGKQRAYITLPAFELTFEWKEQPIIVAVYQYAATKRFIITEVPAAPSDLNFVLCIKYRLEDGTVIRYKLWYDEDEDVLSWIAPYNKEIILANATLEIWSLNEDELTIDLEDDYNFTLSILQVRQNISDDDTCEDDAASSIVTDLENTNTFTPSSVTVAQAFPLSLNPNLFLFGYYEASALQVGQIGTWIPTRTIFESGYSPEMGTTEFKTAALGPYAKEAEWTIAGKQYVRMTGGAMYGGNSNLFNPYTIVDNGDGTQYGLLDENGRAVVLLGSEAPLSSGYYHSYTAMVIRQRRWTSGDKLTQILNVTNSQGHDIIQNPATPSLKMGLVGPSNSAATIGNSWFIVEIWYDTNNFKPHLKITNLHTGEATEATNNLDNSPTELVSYLLGDVASDFDLAALGIYVTNVVDSGEAFPEAQRALIVAYLTAQFNGTIGLPLTFTEQQHGVAN